jgi:hypothetical protein
LDLPASGYDHCPRQQVGAAIKSPEKPVSAA